MTQLMKILWKEKNDELILKINWLKNKQIGFKQTNWL